MLAFLIVGTGGVVSGAEGTIASDPEREETPDPLEKLLPEPPRKVVALTFDDGPHPLFTELLLDVLRTYKARATFFVVGQRVQQFPEVCRLIVRAGSELANHTETHPNLLKIPPEEIGKELDGGVEAIREVTGKTVKYFRPPGGDYDREVIEIAKKHGYPMVLWTINTADYTGRPATEIERIVTHRARSGSIVLMHNGMIETARALPAILEDLRAKGYEFVTISELYSMKRPPDRRAFEHFYGTLAVQFGVEEKALWALDKSGMRPEEILTLCRLSRRSGRPLSELIDACERGLSLRVIAESLGETIE